MNRRSVHLVSGGKTERSIVAKQRAPRCPRFLGPIAKAEWRRLARDLFVGGHLTDLDQTLFAVYCQAWEQVVQLHARVDRHGVVSHDEAGTPVPPSHATALHDARDMLLRSAVELGLTPASRARIESMRSP